MARYPPWLERLDTNTCRGRLRFLDISFYIGDVAIETYRDLAMPEPALGGQRQRPGSPNAALLRHQSGAVIAPLYSNYEN